MTRELYEVLYKSKTEYRSSITTKWRDMSKTIIKYKETVLVESSQFL